MSACDDGIPEWMEIPPDVLSDLTDLPNDMAGQDTGLPDVVINPAGLEVTLVKPQNNGLLTGTCEVTVNIVDTLGGAGTLTILMGESEFRNDIGYDGPGPVTVMVDSTGITESASEALPDLVTLNDDSVVISYSLDNATEVSANPSKYGFKAPVHVKLDDNSPAFGDRVRVRVADINGDGWQDILVVEKLSGVIRTVLNYQGTAFLPVRVIMVGNQPVDVDIFDLDGDGINDIVTADQEGWTFTVIFGRPIPYDAF